MSEPSEQSNWREYLSVFSDSFGVIGGAVALVGFILWLLGLFSGGLFISVVSIGSTLFCVWLMGYVFVRNRDPLQSLGTLRDSQKLIDSASSLEAGKLAIAAPKPNPKLDFEIDEAVSQVRRGDGLTEIRAIYVDVKLKCFKSTDGVVAVVRAFHVSLHRTWPGGDEVIVIAQEDSQKVTEFPDGPTVHTGETWRITEPDTDYRVYRFTLQVTPKVQFSLSPDHVLRVTMEAVGQAPISQTIYVNDWNLPISGISLSPREEFPLAARKQISDLKMQLASYEKTNENLGRHNQQFDWLLQEAKGQHADISEWVKVDRCERGYLILHPTIGKRPTVALSIWVINRSVLDISLSNKLDGVIKFQDTKLLEGKEVTSPVTDVPSGETRCLTFEQILSPADVKMLSDAFNVIRPQFFNFEDLIVTIIGGKRSPDIPSAPLKIGKSSAKAFHPSSALAFPMTLEESGQRIRALAEVRGSCHQLHEPLRISNQTLAKEVIETWKTESLVTLKRVFQDEASDRIWAQITHKEPIPTEATSQGAFLRCCLIELGALLVEETGEYIRNTKKT